LRGREQRNGDLPVAELNGPSACDTRSAADADEAREVAPRTCRVAAATAPLETDAGAGAVRRGRRASTRRCGRDAERQYDGKASDDQCAHFRPRASRSISFHDPSPLLDPRRATSLSCACGPWVLHAM